MNVKNKLLAILVLLLAQGVYVAKANAAVGYRTVCFLPGIWDGRYNCPTSGSNPRDTQCKSGDRITPPGHVYVLMDKQPKEENDRYIGTYLPGGNGGMSCVNFYWNDPYDEPDIYPIYENVVGDWVILNESHVSLRQTNQLPYPKVSFRNGAWGNPDAFVARNCGVGQTCYILNGNPIDYTFTVSAEHRSGIRALESARKGLHISHLNASRDKPWDIYMVYPGYCSASGAAGCTTGPAIFKIESGQDQNPYVPAHEMGHIVQLAFFDENSLVGPTYWSMFAENVSEATATAEGFADFFSAAAYWDPGNVNARPRLNNADLEDPAPLHTNGCTTYNYHRIPWQISKGFWDMADANNEYGHMHYDPFSGRTTRYISWHDESTVPIHVLIDVFFHYPHGTGNRQTQENDLHGVNLWDYDYWVHNSGIFSYSDAGKIRRTLLYHNCLTPQDYL